MKRRSKKPVTTEDLAIMVSKGFDEVKAEANSVKTELALFKNDTEENFKKVRRDILDIGDRFVSRHEFDSFLVRFNHLD